jgi:hypothetical protein
MADQEYTRTQPDWALDKKLEELRRQYEADSEFPDVIAVWEAIEHLTRAGPAPFPAWVIRYLSAASEKVGRLWLGIRPDDDQPLLEKNFSDIGGLRMVLRGEGDKRRPRDVRTEHVAEALGFGQKGRSAFRQHDQSTRDADYLRKYDNPALEEDKQLKHEVQSGVIKMMMKNEGIDSEEAARNRLSRARYARSRNHHQT